MKIENLRAPRTLRSAELPRANASLPSLGPSARAPIGKVQQIANPMSGEERRSQRVLLRVRAQVHVAVEGKAATFDVQTVNVNPRGAMVVMQRALLAGTRLVLENKITRERVACKVARQPRESAEGYQVPLEFDSPAPRFWRIAFPPLDWRPGE